MHLKKKKKSCFRYNGLCQDKEKHRKPADFFFFFLIYCMGVKAVA